MSHVPRPRPHLGSQSRTNEVIAGARTAAAARVPKSRVRGQAQQARKDGHLDNARDLAAEHATRPLSRDAAAPRPEMNRQERVSFIAYVVMGVLVAAFLAAIGVLWWLGA